MRLSVARRMWLLYEPIHAVTYFADESREAADAVGYRGFWMGYCAMRAAPLGLVGPAAVTAAFFGFAPERIERALPDAWQLAGPDVALQARLTGVDGALRRLWGPDVLTGMSLARAADLAAEAAVGANVAGRVLGAANQALPSPRALSGSTAAHLELWQALTTLREHRGDGHVAALVSADVSPVQSHLLKAAAGEAPGDRLQQGRAWSDESWESAKGELVARGWLTADGQLTQEGRRCKDDIEARTDAAAASPWDALGPAGTAELEVLLAPLTAAVLDSGLIPAINPIGLPLQQISEHDA
jgi:hypothetical protein